MKRNIIAVMAFLIAASLNAKTEVTVYDLSVHPSVHNSGKPIVNHDGDDVTIRCDSTINDVDIVIRDQYGTVMHQSTQTIGPDETSLYVPDVEGDSEKTTIDLYYDNKHLSGYFEE